MQRTNTWANKPTHVSRKCKRTNATIQIKQWRRRQAKNCA